MSEAYVPVHVVLCTTPESEYVHAQELDDGNKYTESGTLDKLLASNSDGAKKKVIGHVLILKKTFSDLVTKHTTRK